MMSRARIEQLKKALENAEWITSSDIKYDDLFKPEGEQIIWELYNLKIDKKITLTFYLFDYLGRRTDKLSDILYVEEKSNKMTLYFEKIGTDVWKSSLKEFIRNLY